MIPFSFDDITAPLHREKFLADHWTKGFLHLSGEKGRFGRILSWDDLNAILDWHGPVPPLLRLFQDGRPIDPRRFVDGQPGSMALNPGGLTACLSLGATLILDSADKFAPGIADLAATMQEALCGLTHANLYASWKPQKGFDLHWDPQELFVLQLSGRKRWQIHRPTRPFPLKEDPEQPAPPEGKPDWEHVLEDGDVLYLPRGWWHVAQALDGPSLHLTVSVSPPNGAEFLQWWTRRLLLHPEIRENLSADPAAREGFQARLHALIAEELARDPAGEFLHERRAARRTWPRLNLPSAALAQQAPLLPATRLRLSGAYALFFEPGATPQSRMFRAGGNSWNFAAELMPALEKLTQRSALSFAELGEGLSEKSIANLSIAIDVLAKAGIVLKDT